ncbi:ubiquitin-conjugating enzyme family protein [Entamoeba histolytica]|nr:ubiquitin-conjugating enzyme family protein [Entamoeba histolytica]
MNKLKKMIKEQTPTNVTPEKTPSPNGDGQQSGISKVARARLQKDFAEYEPIPGCIFEQVDKNDITKFKLSISPLEGYYQGGKWSFLFECPRDYPNNPPKVTCVTPIYHPNIDLEGHVCLSTLRLDKDWSPVSTLNHVVCGLLSLFLEPNPDDPLNTEAGETMKRDINEFVRLVNKTMKGGRFFGKDFPRFK